MLRIANHRRFTANHTWHVDVAGMSLFVKANPHHAEASDEYAGHARLSGLYAVPRLRTLRRFPRWTVLVYDRWPHVGDNRGLLVDVISDAEITGSPDRLDECLTSVFEAYSRVIGHTLRRTTHQETISKLYGDRVMPGGRLDCYYQPDAPWPIDADTQIRPRDLADLRLIVNEREHHVDLADLMTWLRSRFAPQTPTWAAMTQGDPTDINIGWSPTGGPIWFDYDTGGLNALAGEFACFLVYQRLHGAWLTPRYNHAAFRDHPSTLDATRLAVPVVHATRGDNWLEIGYRHPPSAARRHVIRRYLDEIVHPIARRLGIDDLIEWMRPYLVMRLLGVYNVAKLEPRDAALSLALLAQVLDPETRLADFLGITQSRTEVA